MNETLVHLMNGCDHEFYFENDNKIICGKCKLNVEGTRLQLKTIMFAFYYRMGMSRSMSCGCAYVEEGDANGFHAGAEIRTARKIHKCTECGRTINPGEKYEYASGCWEGEWEHYKTCEDCLSVREEFFCGNYSIYSIWDDLYYHIEGMDGNIKAECLERLTPSAKSKVIDLIDHYWEECDKFRERYLK